MTNWRAPYLQPTRPLLPARESVRTAVRWMDVGTSTSGDLMRHMRAYMGEHLHDCTVDGRGYSASSSVAIEEHTRAHDE